MKILRDLFLGILCGILVVAGIVIFVPEGREIFDQFMQNTGVDVEQWVNDTTEVYFTKLFPDGSQVSENDTLVADTGNTGEGYSFSSLMNPYYAMLNENQQALYKQMYANASALTAVFAPDTTITVEEVEDVFQAVFYDHPELFWLDTSYSYKYYDDGTIAEISLKFNGTADDIETSRTLFEQSAQAIIQGALQYSNPFDQESYVHDALVNLITYDLEAAYNQSAYSALVNHSTVCAGYAKAFQYIMKQLDLPTYYVTGTSENEDHAWNIIYINGVYYNVDVTWDDTSGQLRMFYNVSDEQLSQTHTRTGLSVNLPLCQ